MCVLEHAASNGAHLRPPVRVTCSFTTRCPPRARALQVAKLKEHAKPVKGRDDIKVRGMRRADEGRQAGREAGRSGRIQMPPSQRAAPLQT